MKVTKYGRSYVKERSTQELIADTVKFHRDRGMSPAEVEESALLSAAIFLAAPSKKNRCPDDLPNFREFIEENKELLLEIVADAMKEFGE